MDATVWTLIALFVFLGGMVYLKVPAMVTKSLDDRSDAIRDELEEARKLREEAQEMLADFQARRKQAEEEAQEIVAAARREAATIAKDAERKTAEFVQRRTAVAEQKIGQAEATAVAEVRAAAIDVAVTAAEQIIGGKMTAATANKLIENGIAEVKSKMN